MKCPRCGDKDAKFSKDAKKKSGFRSECKKCQAEDNRRYREAKELKYSRTATTITRTNVGLPYMELSRAYMAEVRRVMSGPHRLIEVRR